MLMLMILFFVVTGLVVVVQTGRLLRIVNRWRWR